MIYQVFVFVVFVFVGVGFAAKDPCTEIPDCEECVAETFCGWCSEFIVYENGKKGRNCAYQGPDAVPFFCPKDYQTETCTPQYYMCNNVTYQCVPTDSALDGKTIDDCVKSCFPPTFVCDEKTGVCEKSTPGTGTSFDVCNSTCGQEPDDLYNCDPATLSCVLANKNDTGGTTLDVCNSTCGQASNNTPAFTKGAWRGLQINKGYMEGEWKMVILEDNTILIERPDQSVFAAGTLLQMQSELWIENQIGVMRGLFQTTQLPTVLQFTWALGNAGEIVPNNYESAMEESTPSNVFIFYKCLDGNDCDFSQFFKPALRKRLAPAEVEKPLKQDIQDACSVHPDCDTCIGDKENRCGWCDVNVYYKNGTVEGKNCAGHNADGSKEPFVCNSVYSTETCSFPTADPKTASEDTSSEDTTDEDLRYNCNATAAECQEVKGGTFEFLVDCEAQCVKIPDIPIDLLGTWRGLEIRQGYVVGEWRAEIDQGKVSIKNPAGKISVGTAYLVGPYFVLDLQDGPMKGKITTLWQISFSAVTRNLQWAWSEPGKDAPATFEAALKKPYTEFAMVSCIFGKPVEQCDFAF